MIKTTISVVVCLALSASLWWWAANRFTTTSHQSDKRFAYVQKHENDALRSILCYLERRTLTSKTIPDSQKVESIHTLDQIDRVGHLRPCTNLPKLKHAR